VCTTPGDNLRNIATPTDSLSNRLRSGTGPAGIAGSVAEGRVTTRLEMMISRAPSLSDEPERRRSDGLSRLYGRKERLWFAPRLGNIRRWRNPNWPNWTSTL
jgi:hypothetical protein